MEVAEDTAKNNSETMKDCEKNLNENAEKEKVEISKKLQLRDKLESLTEKVYMWIIINLAQ